MFKYFLLLPFPFQLLLRVTGGCNQRRWTKGFTDNKKIWKYKSFLLSLHFPAVN